MSIISVFEKSPGEITTVTLDLVALGVIFAGISISSVSWTIATGITQVSASNTSTTISLKTSGGTLYQTYRATAHIMASNGEQPEISVDIKIVPK